MALRSLRELPTPAPLASPDGEAIGMGVAVEVGIGLDIVEVTLAKLRNGKRLSNADQIDKSAGSRSISAAVFRAGMPRLYRYFLRGTAVAGAWLCSS